jgi:copper(I)-binding protein
MDNTLPGPATSEFAMRQSPVILAAPILVCSFAMSFAQAHTPADLVAWHAAPVDTNRFTEAAADTSGMHFDHVWARPTAGPASAGAVWFTVTNDGPADQLIGASTPVAASAGVHETIDDNGVMKMRPVPSLTLDTGKPVTLKPGGYHVMLMGLKSPLKAGDSFPLTITFAHAPPQTVTVKVEAGGGAMPGMPGMR